jgi:3-methyladenine DNA glycosylase AlkD
LAACMVLRLSEVAPTAELLRRWAPALDNWLSVDELGAVVGLALHGGQLQLDDVAFAARAASPWQRRLFLVALITPIRRGLDPVHVPLLVDVLPDAAKPVRKAAMWLISSVVKDRPDTAAQFGAMLAESGPRPLVRLLAAQV